MRSVWSLFSILNTSEKKIAIRTFCKTYCVIFLRYALHACDVSQSNWRSRVNPSIYFLNIVTILLLEN